MSARECHPMLEGMSEQMRATFVREAHDAYAEQARKHDEAAAEAERIGDEREMRACRTVAEHCRSMARRVLHGIFDEPETHRSFYAFDDAIADRRALYAVMVDAEFGRDVAMDNAKRKVVAAAMHVLTQEQRRVVEVYIVGGVSRKDAPEMLQMAEMTFDTHVRDINLRWREWLDALTSGRGVQNVLLAGDDGVPPPTVAKERRPRVPVDAPKAEQVTLEV